MEVALKFYITVFSLVCRIFIKNKKFSIFSLTMFSASTLQLTSILQMEALRHNTFEFFERFD